MTFHPLRCDHHHVCWAVHAHNNCINDKPHGIPCCFDTRLHANITTTERDTVLDRLDNDIPVYLLENSEGTVRDFIDFLLEEFKELRTAPETGDPE